MKTSELKVLLTTFMVWRAMLFFILFVAVLFVPFRTPFLSGGILNHLANPQFWSWSNFDGVHYVSIALKGYRQYQYFFFPLYPILINFVGSMFGETRAAMVGAGLFISHLSFIFAVLGFYKLTLLDHSRKTAFYSIGLLMLFPTSFYFVSVYTESLFLALAVWSFYFARKEKWFTASLLAGLLTATRVVGVAIIPALLIEFLFSYRTKKRKTNVESLYYLLLAPIGILCYMLFLRVITGDFLEFFHNVGIYGDHRTAGIVFLPQVFYRYIFKILPALSWNYFPVVFTTLLELVTALAFVAMAVVSALKMKFSYAIYTILGFLIPTFSGCICGAAISACAIRLSGNRKS